ncbi:hypothetical protein DFS34DRAFT_651841 [Phlyctochytrium arcticum]|nr:hypothetical protein DFS34DRAFT_651841 [Phlyctochytrium arcticum]
MGNLPSSTQKSSDVLINDLTFLVSVLLSINYYVYPQRKGRDFYTGTSDLGGEASDLRGEGGESTLLQRMAAGWHPQRNPQQNPRRNPALMMSAQHAVPEERPQKLVRRVKFPGGSPPPEPLTPDQERSRRFAALIKTYKKCRHSIVQRTRARGGGRWLFGRDDRKEPNDVGVAENLDQLKRLVILDIRNCVARLYMTYMVNLGKNTVALSQSSGRGGSLGAGPTSATVGVTATDAITNHLMYSNDFCQVMVERVIQTVLPQNTLDVLRQKELGVMKLLRETMSKIRGLSDSVHPVLSARRRATPKLSGKDAQTNADDRRQETALLLFRMTCDCIRDQFDRLLRSAIHEHSFNIRGQDELANLIGAFMDNVAKSLIESRDLIAAICEAQPIPYPSFPLPKISELHSILDSRDAMDKLGEAYTLIVDCIVGFEESVSVVTPREVTMIEIASVMSDFGRQTVADDKLNQKFAQTTAIITQGAAVSQAPPPFPIGKVYVPQPYSEQSVDPADTLAALRKQVSDLRDANQGHAREGSDKAPAPVNRSVDASSLPFTRPSAMASSLAGRYSSFNSLSTPAQQQQQQQQQRYVPVPARRPVSQAPLNDGDIDRQFTRAQRYMEEGDTEPRTPLSARPNRHSSMERTEKPADYPDVELANTTNPTATKRVSKTKSSSPTRTTAARKVKRVSKTPSTIDTDALALGYPISPVSATTKKVPKTPTRRTWELSDENVATGDSADGNEDGITVP